uniref:RAP domain-containing protein n=1 Tax=Dunaliella tertiolecta TaxID=3047 RepID=A0A7S3R5T0_DUNTE
MMVICFVMQGNVKVAVMQVVPGEHTFLSFEQRLLAEHQVKVDLLQRHGWLVVQVPLAEWGQNSSQEQRVQDMDARLKWTLGNRNAVSPENCALLENPQF